MPDAKRAKILLVSPMVPFPSDLGPRETMLSMIRMLAADFDVTVLALAWSKDDLVQARELEPFCKRVIPIMAPSRKSTLHRLAYGSFYRVKSTIMRRSLKQMRGCPGALLQAARVLARERFDLVVVSFWQLYRVTKLFPKGTTVLVTHDIDMLVNHQISLLERNLVKKVQAVRRWLMERPEELAAYRATNHVWALSEQDAGVVEKICRDHCCVDVLPYGIDVDFFAPSGMQRNQGEVLFLGPLDEASNRDALEFFARKIYPHIDDLPGLSITIVGGSLPDELGYFGLLPEVEVVSKLSDVRPYLHRASCLIAPSRFGGGLRIGVLQAMAAGLPVVASAVAMNGLPFEAGREYLAADEPTDYPEAIKTALGGDDEVRGMADAASSRVGEAFGTKPQRDKIVALVRKAMAHEPV